MSCECKGCSSNEKLIRQLKAANTRLRQDAERYRFLKKRAVIRSHGSEPEVFLFPQIKIYESYDIDSVIDRAIQDRK